MKKLYLLLLTGLIIASFFAPKEFKEQTAKITHLVAAPSPSPTPSSPAVLSETIDTQTVKVTRVIDGDTIEVEGGKKVRYIGIDTPELHDPRKPIQCFAREAAEKNKELVLGKSVKLERDVSNTDRYGRLLRYVYLPKEGQESTGEAFFVNDFLVRQGYAQAATFPPDVKYQEDFGQAQQEAQEANRGLWKECIQ